jgi:anti-sigma factor RsiW
VDHYNQEICAGNLIADYLEGELDKATSDLVEKHLAGCERCRIELRAQQLFMCELDAAMTQHGDLDVPDDFSRVVAVRAGSDMRGVRSTAEHKKGLVISLVLSLIAFALLGTAARESTIRFGRRAVGSFLGLVEFLWNASYDAVASLTVVSRVLSRKFVVESGSLGLVIVVLALAVFLLSRLISNYHRTGTIE